MRYFIITAVALLLSSALIFIVVQVVPHGQERNYRAEALEIRAKATAENRDMTPAETVRMLDLLKLHTNAMAKKYPSDKKTPKIAPSVLIGEEAQKLTQEILAHLGYEQFLTPMMDAARRETTQIVSVLPDQKLAWERWMGQYFNSEEVLALASNGSLDAVTIEELREIAEWFSAGVGKQVSVTNQDWPTRLPEDSTLLKVEGYRKELLQRIAVSPVWAEFLFGVEANEGLTPYVISQYRSGENGQGKIWDQISRRPNEVPREYVLAVENYILPYALAPLDDVVLTEYAEFLESNKVRKLARRLGDKGYDYARAMILGSNNLLRPFRTMLAEVDGAAPQSPVEFEFTSLLDRFSSAPNSQPVELSLSDVQDIVDHYRSDEYPSAAQALNLLRGSSPDNPEVLYALAQVTKRMAPSTSARKSFMRVFEPDTVDEVNGYLLKAIELDSDFYEAHAYLGEFLIHQSDLAGAQRHLEIADQGGLEDPWLDFAFAKLSFEQDDIRRSLDILEELLKSKNEPMLNQAVLDGLLNKHMTEALLPRIRLAVDQHRLRESLQYRPVIWYADAVLTFDTSPDFGSLVRCAHACADDK